MTVEANAISTAPRARAPETARWLALGAIAGPALFTLAWVVLGLLRPGYSPVSDQISGLGVGPDAPLMNAAFVLQGLLLLAGVAGIFSRTTGEARGVAARLACAALLALPALGSAMDGVFTWQSAIRLHLLGFSLVLTPVLGFLATGFFLRGVPRWRRFGSWLLLGSPLTLALAYLFFQTFSPYAPAGTGVAGLTERILVVEVLAWYVAMGWLAFRRP
jgi:hypothetical membrane protein